MNDEIVVAQTPNVDYRSLDESPTPEEFFLLSRVKGEVTVGQLCAASGLGRDRAIEMIERLLRFGLLTAVNSDYTPPPTTEADMDLFGPPTGRTEARDDLFSTSKSKDGDDDLFGPPQDEDDSLFSISAKGEDVPRGLAGPEEDTYVPSFASEVIDTDAGEDDDLFQFDSPAHKSKITRPRPVSTVAQAVLGEDPKTQRAAALVSDSEVEKIRDPDFHADSESIVVRTKKSEYRIEDRPNYAQFPVPFDSWSGDYRVLPNIEPELQREVHYVFAFLDQLTYYHLFGVGFDATRKQIRTSYFKFSKRFHPDLFFGQDVGELADMAESVFKFASKAYDTLGKKKKRVEYDEALRAHIRASQQMDSMSDRKRQVAQDTLANRARDFANRGDFVKAASEIRRALSISPSRDLALEGAGLLLRANMKLDEAAMYARTVLKERPDDIQAMVMLGRIYEQNGMTPDALKMYERAAGFAPDDASIRVHVERIKSGTS